MDTAGDNNDDLETMNTVVEAARSRYSSMLNKEARTATVTSGQPEFMHNLVFQ